MAAILLTPLEAEPLSVADAKAYLRVETDDDDVLIASLIAAARSHVEALGRCALLTQTWRLTLDGWPPDGRIKPKISPLSAIAAVRVYDEAGTAHVLDPENFVLDAAQNVIAMRACSLPQPGRAAAGIEIDVVVGIWRCGQRCTALSKSATANTSSVVFSDAFSGRAEFGLTGDDDFHLKVSADGTAWRDALKFDRTTGRVSFPSGGARETLVADRTYYVRSADGSDSNDGLSNSSGGAFHTIAKAIAAATALDLSIYRVTINLTGNFAENAVLKSYVGAGPIVIVGDETTPSNCTVTGQTGSTAVFLADTTLGRWDIRGVKITSAVSGQHGINSTNNSVVGFQNVDFGSLNAGYHLAPTDGGILVATGNYKISGGAMYHAAAIQGSLMRTAFRSVAISNTPAFSGAFAYATALSSIRGQSMSFTGTGATGKRYQVDLASAIIVGGAGATYLPGDSAGTADGASSGIYS